MNRNRVIECESGYLVQRRHHWFFWAYLPFGPSKTADEAIAFAKRYGFKRVVWP